MSKAEIIFMYVTVILGLIAEAVIALGLIILALNGIGLLLDMLTGYISPMVGIMLVALIYVAFIVCDGGGIK